MGGHWVEADGLVAYRHWDSGPPAAVQGPIEPGANSDADRLWDEVARAIREDGWTCDFHEPDEECGDCRVAHLRTASAVLAVVRRHVEALSRHYACGDPPLSGGAFLPAGYWLRRDDVLRLLGASDE